MIKIFSSHRISANVFHGLATHYSQRKFFVEEILFDMYISSGSIS